MENDIKNSKKDFLNDLANKQEISDMGKSPYSKKRASNRVVRINNEDYDRLRNLAFDKHTSIVQELNDLMSDGYRYREFKDKND